MKHTENNEKTFFRVGKEDCSGLWYDQQGEFHGLIHKLDLSNKDLQMPYDKEIVGWLSASDSMEDMLKWFNHDDIKLIEPLGYKVLEYKTRSYKMHGGHFVINQKESLLIGSLSREQLEEFAKQNQQ